MEAILKNQFKHVSLAVSLTLSGEKLSGKKKRNRNRYILSGYKLLFSLDLKLYSLSARNYAHHNKLSNMLDSALSRSSKNSVYRQLENTTCIK